MNRYVNYEPTPFYFINDTIDREEIVRQLNTMQETGVSSFFLHVRDGILDQAYGTAVFFENVKFLVDEAAKRGVHVWLYDEDSFPSGNAGGQIAIEYPELQACSLKVDKLKAEEIKNGIARRVLGKVRGLFGYAVYNGADGEKSQKLTDCFGVVRRSWNRRDMDKTYYCDMQNKLFFPHVRAGTSYAEIMFEAKIEGDADVYVAYLAPVFTDNHYGLQADCLNRRTTEEFLKRTHEKYAEYVGDYFGNIIPGIFIDEPSAGGLLPYTKEIGSCFERLWGYDVTDFYYQLSAEYTGDGKKVRREYIQTVTELFCENFISPISAWCKEHNLLFTGHFYGEEDPLSSALCAQSVYRQTKLMGIPGFDIIGRYLGDRKHCALLLGSKIVVSSAVQSGKERILAECFALNPFNFGYEGLRKMGDWLFACGINWLAPHAFHYGYGAYQRADAGKSFFFQDRLYDEYLRFAQYAGRVCKWLSEYRQENKTLVVLPSGGLNEEVPFPMCNTGVYPTDRALGIQDRCYQVVRYLTENQIGWDIADVAYTLSATIENAQVKIGNGVYDKVIVIQGGEKEKEVYQKLKAANVDCLCYEGTSFEGFPNAYGLKGDSLDVLLYEKHSEKGKLLYLYQNDKRFAQFQIPTKEKVWAYDEEKDELQEVECKDDYINVGIKGYGSLMLFIGEPPALPIKGKYAYTVEGERKLECEENPQWIYLPQGVEYAITTYDIEITYQDKKETFKKHKYARLRDLIGTQDELYRSEYVIPYFDTAKRPESMYPCQAVFRAEVPYREGEEYLLFDGSSVEGEYRLFWNGEEISREKMERYRVYDAKNYICKPNWRKGSNLLEIRFDKGQEFDGVSGEIYTLKK